MRTGFFDEGKKPVADKLDALLARCKVAKKSATQLSAAIHDVQTQPSSQAIQRLESVPVPSSATPANRPSR